MSAPRAVLLDALGTLVGLDGPVELLAAELARRGAVVEEAAVGAALRAEMRFYRAQHDRAVDAGALEALRDDCAEVLRDALPPCAASLGVPTLREALLAALRFTPYPEVPGVLRALRTAGHPLVVVSNWDVSLHDVLADTGLGPLLDGVLTSAQERVAKPDPELFARALALAGREASRALHAGDSVEHDIAGAHAAGITAVLVDRDATARAPHGAAVVRDLEGLLALAAG
ncbi:MAG: HAD-IA family hydrolase [Solirubrobacteraceae bacterium MAG38_C4-C5]|nr:HAD-IA family hydrolase [Candidatus Siliceabacter maunaloa]